MASSKEYLEFVLEQLSDLDGIAYRAMMGEYIIYYTGKVIGGIYDDRFLVKQTKSSIELLSDTPLETPYYGAKNMFLIDVDNKELLNQVIPLIADDIK
ncbi:MAG: TfoX/Sxy family protein [Clostridia bacterium]|nr:TfoX/Sxy family protein [Clostridia bacterium]